MHTVRISLQRAYFVLTASPSSILSKGLSCSDLDKKHSHASVQANIPQAARYYCQGLEFENDRSEREIQADEAASSADATRDNGDIASLPAGQVDTPLVVQVNTEVVQDIAHGLCILYRHGKIRPECGSSPVLQAAPARPKPPSRNPSEKPNGKGKEKAIEVSEKDLHDSDSPKGREGVDRRSSTWTRGGKIASPLITKLERLLGLVFPDFLDDREALTEEPESLSETSPSPPSLPSRHTSPDPGSQISPKKRPTISTFDPADDGKIKKSVSFSRLPPKHRALTAGAVSLLDAVSSRQARSALVHLWYISALCAFADGEPKQAGRLWDKITILGKEQGSGSKEADEIVEKAKIRLGMLADTAKQSAVTFAQKEEKLSLHQMLSPVDSHGNAKETNGFHFGAPARGQSSHSSPTNAAVPTQNEGFARAVAQAHIPTPPLETSSDGSDLLKPPTNGNSRRQSKPKFALHDSPTSTIRSYTSHKGDSSSARPKVNSNISQSSQAGPPGKATRKAPWLIRSPSSSTSISGVATSNFPQPSTSASAAQMRSTALPSAAPSNRQAFKPFFRPSVGKSRLGPAAVPSVALSDTSTSNLDYMAPSVSSDFDLRRNATSVASLPHYSTGGTRNQSAAHLLLARSQGSSASVQQQGLGRKKLGSSSSLASLASFSGVQKSFSSLRNFFTGVPQTTRDAETDSILEEEAENTVRKDEPDPTEIIKAKLVQVAERHDAAVAELEAHEAEWGYQYRTYFNPNEETDPYGDEAEDATEESPAPPSFDSSGKRTIQMPARDGIPLAAAPSTPPRSPTTAAEIPSSTDSSAKRKTLRFSTSIPSSSLLVPTRRSFNAGLPSTPPGSPASTQNTPSSARTRPKRDIRSREFFGRDPTSSSVTPQGSRVNLPASDTGLMDPSAHPSGSATPLQSEAAEISGPLKIDPLLAALEAASRVNVKSRCAICGKAGVNFPKCQKCGMTFCSRDCRVASGGDEGLRLGKHIC